MHSILLYTAGTLGDHLPFFALGHALESRGYPVRMAVNASMQAYALQAGLDVIALPNLEGGEAEARNGAAAWNAWETPLGQARKVVENRSEMFIEQCRALVSLCRESDLLITTSIRQQGLIVALATGIPWITASMNPHMFFLSTNPEEKRLQKKAWRDEYNQLAPEMGVALKMLGADRFIPPYTHGWVLAPEVLLAFSPLFARPDPSAFFPRNRLLQTGFWYYQDPSWEEWQPDEDLRLFCEPDQAENRPLVLAFSSQPLENPRHVLEIHARAAARLGKRLVVQRGWAGFTADDLPADVDPSQVLFRDFLPHDWLFRRCACAIQHGGIGSIARALRQGCPVLVEPFGNDQFFNAFRVMELGVGAAMHPYRSTLDGLVKVLEEKVLSSACRNRAEEISQYLQAENGLDTACQMISGILEQNNSRDRSSWRVPNLYKDKWRQAVSTTDWNPGFGIPKVIHQIWKDQHIPASMTEYRESWRHHHPGWKYYLWTDQDLRAFIDKHYHWFLPVYDAYPEPILRVEAARYFLLYHYGGVYAEQDLECLKPLDPLLTSKELMLVQESEVQFKAHFPVVKPFDTLLGTALMVSARKHPFWEHVFRRLEQFCRMDDILETAGNFFLSRAYACYPEKEQISIVPVETIYPFVDVECSQGEYSTPQGREKLKTTSYTVPRGFSTSSDPHSRIDVEKAKVVITNSGKPVHTYSLQVNPWEMQDLLSGSDFPRVACLLDVCQRSTVLKQAIFGFAQQTYPNCELWVMGEPLPEDVTASPFHQVQAKTAADLGKELQQAGVDYVAYWQPDGLHDPDRLAIQIHVLQNSQADLCLLSRQQELTTGWLQFRYSPPGYWEQSQVARVDAISQLLQGNLEQWISAGESLVQGGQVAWIDAPHLLTRVIAGEGEQECIFADKQFLGEAGKIMVEKLENRLNMDLNFLRKVIPIPKILHQTWKDDRIPEDLRQYQQTWEKHHPGWRYILWTDIDNRELIRQHYSWFLPIFDAYPEPIMRVDAARYFILYHFGGMYVDLDFEAFRPLDPLLEGKQVVLGLEPESHLKSRFAIERNLQQIVCNAWMASVPGHPFWEHVFKKLVEYHFNPDVLDATSPYMLSRAYSTYADPSQITLVPESLLYPIDNATTFTDLPPEEQARIRSQAYAIHHWRGGWWRPTNSPAVISIQAEVRHEKQVVSRFWLRVDRYLALLQKLDKPLVSCMMITKDRPRLAERAIQCFLNQTYPNRELLILDDGDDDRLEQFVKAQNHPMLRFFRLPREGKTLGELRNLAMNLTSGEFVTQWDDDDLSDPQRIEIQMAAILVQQVDACLLQRHTIWYPQKQRLAISNVRQWESSFICRKAIMPAYPALSRGEDTPVIDQIGAGKIVWIDYPQLYVYTFHGRNTFDALHWEGLWRAATESYEGDSYLIKLAEFSRKLGIDMRLTDADTSSLDIPRHDQSKSTGGQNLTPAQVKPSTPSFQSDQLLDNVLVLIPVTNAVRYLPGFLANLRALSYSHSQISLAFLESDSRDGTHAWLEQAIPGLKEEFRRVSLFKRDYGYLMEGGQWETNNQRQRRSILARRRNYLLSQALQDESWVLWLDVELARIPQDVIERLLASGKEIVVPNSVVLGTDLPYDLSTYKLKPDAREIDWRMYVVDGILQPPPGEGRWYLNDLALFDTVEVDSVGGTLLLVRADLHREGLNFPSYPYHSLIETEGMAAMAKEMGYRCWGLPKLVIHHPGGLT
ncbi:MAG TPA: glycosyltransferase [Anaerolineaceae bacterium]